jgi:hypothetical protein
MPRGNSGRVVVEVSPDVKNRLYRALSSKNLTLKAWFLRAAEDYISDNEQPGFLRTLDNRKPQADHQ